MNNKNCDLNSRITFFVTGILIIASVTLLNLYVESEKKIDLAEEQRHEVTRLIDQLRQSSNDLSRMVYLYIATNDQRFFTYHQNILDIRDGKLSRPTNYLNAYWEIVLGKMTSLPKYDTSKAISLLDLISQNGLEKDELASLTIAKNISDELAKLEKQIMSQFTEDAKVNIQDAKIKAISNITHKNYFLAMSKIMIPINDVYQKIDNRMRKKIEHAKLIALLLRIAFIVFAFVLYILAWRFYKFMSATLGAPIADILQLMSKVGSGDFTTDIIIKPGMGNSVIAGLSRMQNTLQANEIERKRTEAELRIAAVAFESQESLMITDASGIILRVNKAFTETTGYTAEEAVGQTPRLLKSGRHDTDFYHTMWETINHTGTWHGEIWGRRKNGELYPQWLTISAVRGEDNKITHYVGSCIDITELSNARIAAEDASRAKSEFLSSISHELRTPLNAILGFAQLLEQGPPAPTLIQTGRIKEIVRSGWYLLDLINEILDLVAIESGKIPLTLQWIPLQELLLECVNMMETQAKLQNITISLEQPCQSLLLYADRIRVKQVLINFLSNAIKYNCENGIIEIACNPASTPNQARISIRDTGKGLPANKLEQLFQPFNRLGQETGPIEGTGIGLVLAKKLTEQMGGTIGVDSTVGKGSIFWFELPATRECNDLEGGIKSAV